MATQDWHPANHVSFASQHPGKKVFDTIDMPYGKQVLWPDHCVQNTEGAKFAQDLQVDLFDAVVQKGTDVAVDSYSGFFGNDKKQQTGMDAILKDAGVTEVHVLGLATDYCVYFTALDAKNLGYETYFIEDGSRGVAADSTATAIADMKAKGIHVVSSPHEEL